MVFKDSIHDHLAPFWGRKLEPVYVWLMGKRVLHFMWDQEEKTWQQVLSQLLYFPSEILSETTTDRVVPSTLKLGFPISVKCTGKYLYRHTQRFPWPVSQVIINSVKVAVKFIHPCTLIQSLNWFCITPFPSDFSLWFDSVTDSLLLIL